MGSEQTGQMAEIIALGLYNNKSINQEIWSGSCVCTTIKLLIRKSRLEVVFLQQ